MDTPSYMQIVVTLVLGAFFGTVLYQWWAGFDKHQTSAVRAWITRGIAFVVSLLVIAAVIHLIFQSPVCGEFCDRQY